MITRRQSLPIAVSTFLLSVPVLGQSFPLPVPGQTVRWSPAHSPVVVNGSITIPAGGTVEVDPGVEIRLSGGARLGVRGTLNAVGTSAVPIRITKGSGAGLQGVVNVYGVFRLQHADVTGAIDPIRSGLSNPVTRGSVFVADTTFRDTARIGTYPSLSAGGFISLQRCTFTGGARPGNLHLYWLLDDVRFESGGVLAGYWRTRNVTVTGQGLELQGAVQPRFITGIAAAGSSGAGLVLSGSGDFLIDPAVSLTGNHHPIEFGIGSAGLLPGTHLPASGNAVNAVFDTVDTDPTESVTWADPGVPYLVRTNRYSGSIRLLPGTRVEFQPGISLRLEGDFFPRGTPAAPVVFTRHDPSLPWDGLVFEEYARTARMENVVVEGAANGVTGSAVSVHLIESTFRSNGVAHTRVGPIGTTAIRACRFVDNQTAVRVGPLASAFVDGSRGSSAFIGNALAYDGAAFDSDFIAENNYWGEPSGPQHPSNPAGAGQLVENVGVVDVLPFLPAEPDTANTLPTVRLEPVSLWQDPGSRVILNWTASDDSRIVEQRVLYSDSSDTDTSFDLVATLPAAARAFEFTFPALPSFAAPVDPAFIRIVAVDDTGRIGWDQARVQTIRRTPATTFTITQQPPTAAIMGDFAQACWTRTEALPTNGWQAMVMLDSDGRVVPLGAVNSAESACLDSWTGHLPDVSTDFARIGFFLIDGRQDWAFTSEFSIRPDARLGDAAPQVELVSPAHGASIAGGRDVNFTWTASDDQAIRTFDLLASFDGGTFWNRVVSGLPGDQRSYRWRLPASAGIADVRVRIVAHDVQFQNSSDSARIAILPGAAAPCPADIDGSGTVGLQDLFEFLVAYFAADPIADLNGSGSVTVQDVFDFLVAWFAGC